MCEIEGDREYLQTSEFCTSIGWKVLTQKIQYDIIVRKKGRHISCKVRK